VCDHKTVQPLLHRDTAISVTPVEIQEEGEEAKTFIYRLSYNKTGKSRFFGQLEIARSFARAVHRAGLKAAYSKGYHPHLKMSFTGALPLGLESVTEEAYLTLLEEAGPRELLLRLNERLPEGIMVSEAVPTPKVFPRSPFQRVTYRVSGLTLWEVVSILRNVSKRLDDDIVKRTKRREIKVQMRKVLLDIRQVDETSLDMVLCEGPEVCFRPLTVLTHLLEGSSGPLSGCSICRIAVEPVEESDNVRRTYNQL
jgi:radical SAM-linked protein